MSVLACFLAVACSGGASLSGPDETQDGSASVSSVEMTPSSVAVGVDGTAELTLEVRTADGDQLDRDGQWTVRDASVASVKGQGSHRRQVVGRGVGTTRVVGTVDGVADSAEVRVREPGSRPESDVEPVLAVDFEGYNDTDELRSDKETFPVENLGLDGPKGGIYLDRNVGYGPAGLSQSMRYDYVDQGCDSIGRGRGLRLPENSKAVWVEVAVRFSENTTAANADCPPRDWKFLFGQITPDSNGRFSFMAARGLRMGSPRGAVEGPEGAVIDHGDDGREIDAFVEERVEKARIQSFGIDEETELFDGEWHTIRIQFQASDDERTANARMALWIDGVFRGSLSGFSHNDVDIKALMLGRNKDKGVDVGTESAWFGRILVWDENPGW